MSRWVSIKEMTEAGYGCRDTILANIHRGDFKAGNPGGGKWIIELDSYEEWLTTRKPKTKRRYKRK